MTFFPDSLDLGLERAVEAVVIDFFVFDKGVEGDKFPEAFRTYEIIGLAVLFLAAGRTRSR